MLNSEYVIIDVGAGSHNNIIDTFLIADKMIAVLLPEVLAVENLYHFIKSGFSKFLGMETHFVGYVEYEENVVKSIEHQEPFMLFDASSSIAQEVRITVDNLINEREQKV